MSRRKHLPLSFLLLLAFTSAILTGAIIQVQRPDIGRRAVEAQMEARSPRERCDRMGNEWTFVTRTNPDVSLCYKTAWGWPQWERTSIHPESHTGTGYEVSFSAGVAPRLSFESPDFALTGDTDFPQMSWSSLERAASDAEVRALFPGEDVQLFSIGTVAVVKSTLSSVDFDGYPFTDVRYFVLRPDLRIRITVTPEQAEEVEAMLRASL